MNKKFVILFLVGMIFLVGSVSAKESVFSVSVEYHSENISIGDVFVSEATYFEKNYSGDYSLRVLDSDGDELYRRNFDFILDFVYGPPAEGEDFGERGFAAEDVEEVLIIPYFDEAENMEIYFGGEKVTESYVGYLTGSCGDGVCKPHEKNSCSVDCADRERGFFDWPAALFLSIIIVTIIVAGLLIRSVMKDGLLPRLG
jgi:hypothetical protein